MTVGNLHDDPLRACWDVIVVGTGMGGATLGHQLAQAGKRVLFCEAGGGGAPLRGGYPEMAATPVGTLLGASQQSLLQRAGRAAEALLDTSGARPATFVPYIGSGPGGSSALYGMALERFMPDDFESGWPITYADLLPHYAAAERLYGVRGDADPIAAGLVGTGNEPQLLAPPPLSPAGAELAGFLTSRGLHPYRLPSACEFVAGCAGCQGYLCAQACKNDAQRICLQPAVERHGAVLLTQCRVTRLLTSNRRVTGVACRLDGRDVELRARVVVLAAGALQSPLVLLRSEGPGSGSGLGNASGLVGRRLMRHLIDLYFVKPGATAGGQFDNRRKEIACNDFYGRGADRLGTLQSFGRLPPPEMLFGSVLDDVRASRWGWAQPAVRAARPFMLPVLRRMAERWITLASIVEDLPDAGNGIAPDPDNPARPILRYTPTAESWQRALRMRDRVGAVLQGRSWQRSAQAANNQRIAHACGTCRFGDDPRTSVLDRDNRVHDVDNLFVVDSSFFPTSGGTNPSLTVAANALRVGQRITAAMP